MTLTPLATSAQFNGTAYADLATHLQAGDLDNTMLRATRACETVCKRRLAPFTLTETTRLVDGDVEDAISAAIPLPAASQIQMDRASSLGYSQLVRHTWVREYPPTFQDYWTGGITTINVYWSYQQTPYAIPSTSYRYAPDTGHVRFLLGTFVPPGSEAEITYTGGYGTVPEDLVEATIVMAASMIIKSLDPTMREMAHDPDMLRDEAIELLDGYIRG